MKLYFIRHAESESNAGHTYSSFDSKLTATGIKQAEAVARRLKSLPIERLIASTMPRALHTAQIISDHLNVALEHSQLFVEYRRPSEVTGQSSSEPESKKIIAEIESRIHELDWHYSDEENFNDLKQRALAALAYIRSLPNEHIAVVGHGIFLRMLLGCAVHGADLTSHEYWEFLRHLKAHNTGLTTFDYVTTSITQDQAPRWRLVTWNDHAHVAAINQPHTMNTPTPFVMRWLAASLVAVALLLVLWVVLDHQQVRVAPQEFMGRVHVSTSTETGTIKIFAATNTDAIQTGQPALPNLDEIQIRP